MWGRRMRPGFSIVMVAMLLVIPARAGVWDAACVNGLPTGRPCVDIGDSFAEFRSQIENAVDGDFIVFCPFDIVHDGERINPSSQTGFACDPTLGECIINGPGQTFSLNSGSAETLFYGFTFVGMNDAVAFIRDDTTKEQQFCNCIFEGNTHGTRGGAIRTSRGTIVTVRSSTFKDNYAGRGGAIYNRGNMTILDSVFTGNSANDGASVAVANYAFLSLSGNIFDGNAAIFDGPVIFGDFDTADLATEYVDGGWNIATNNGGCEGLYNDETKTCIEFEFTGTPSPSISLSPTKSPTTKPSSSPSATPTMIPSSVPSEAPTQSQRPSNNEPSASPAPSSGPTISGMPTTSPTNDPSVNPSGSPTDAPSLSPSHSPTLTASVSPSMAPTPSYTPPPDPELELLALVDRDQPDGYFNFNMADPDYGPENWKDVDVSENEFMRYEKEEPGFDVSSNVCGRGGIQSPIDLAKTNSACEEFHQIRARGGDWRNMTRSGNILFQVTPRNLRMQIEGDSSKGPRADSPGGFLELYMNHLEVHVPSLHTFDGKRYDAEYSLYHIQGKKNRVLVLSVLVDASTNNYNHQFQKMLNAWGQVQDCGVDGGRRLHEMDLLDLDDDDEEEYIPGDDDDEARRLVKIGGRHDVYHVDLIPSIHWYAYSGSLVQPPCTRNAHWRVYDTPMEISIQQLNQLKGILKFGPCRDDPHRVGLGDSMARPTERDRGRDIWRCTEEDFLSDCERFGILCPAPGFSGN